MFNIERKNEIVTKFIADADACLEAVKPYGNLFEAMESDNVDSAKYLIERMAGAVEAVVPKELGVPGIVLYKTFTGEASKIDIVDLTIKNKHNSDIIFRFKHQFVRSSNIFEAVADFLKMCWVELIVDSLVRSNLAVINAKFADIAKEAGIGFSVKVTSPLNNGGKKVISITDEEVVFVADEERALGMDDILLFAEPSEFLSQERIDDEYKKTVANFAKAQTTVQFLSVHELLVGYLCDISKMVKPMTIIKKVYSKNVNKLRGNSETLAYFNNGEVFSVVSVNLDGKEVVLKPFNIETLEVVDFDVLGAIAG